MALIRAGANLILKILWKLIVYKKKEHLSAQYNALCQNTELKEKRLKKLQMPAHQQIIFEVKEAVQPIVHELAKQNILSLSKEIMPAVI